jgi:hypothetical protein
MHQRYYVDSNPVKTTLQRGRDGHPSHVTHTWHVRDRLNTVSGLGLYKYGKSVACSKDESVAWRIANMLNGYNRA